MTRLSKELTHLEAVGLIKLIKTHPELEFLFRHGLIQEAAYNSLLFEDRKKLHRHVGKAIEESYPNRLEELASTLADHFLKAEMAEKAIHYLLLAGDQARGLYAHQEAIKHYQQALDLLKEQKDYIRVARTLMKLGLTYHNAFDFKEARQAYQEGFTFWQRARKVQPEPDHLLPLAPHALRTNWHDPGTLDPTRPRTIWSVGLAQQLFSGLLALNPELDVIPDVAHSWEVSDGGRTYVFYLRDDVSWSDGVPVTAGDFEYAWQRALDPAGEASFAGILLSDIKGASAFRQGEITDPNQVAVQATDTFTLVVELEGPTNYFPQLLAFPTTFPIPRHRVEQYGETWAEVDHLVTNGPFRLKDWRHEESMSLLRNPTYHNPWRGNVEQLELVLEVDPTTLLQRYEADALDLLHLHLLPPAEMDRARQWHAADYLSGSQLLTNYIWFNRISYPPLNDDRVRQALALALDKGELANVAMKGYVYPARGSFVPPGMPGHAPEVGLPYDPAWARQLLAEAGYAEGYDFPPLEALTRPDHEPLARYCQRAWREVLGIDVLWKTVSSTTFFERCEQSPPDLALALWVADYPDPDCFLRVCIEIDNPDWKGGNYRQLIETARRVTDQAERMRLYRQAERILAEDPPIISLAYGRVHLLLKPWVKRYQLSTVKGQFWKDVIIEPH